MPRISPRQIQDALFHVHDLKDRRLRHEYLEKLGRENPALRQEVESLFDASPTTQGDSAPETLGDHSGFPTIPGYRLLEVLDSGGFGTVYRGQPDNPDLKPVAVKVLQPGKRSEAVTARFCRERELHAQMDHPFVARVMDTGTTAEGQPFLVMELVRDSLNLIEYADRQQLTVAERLELFGLVCEGVHHLHLQGIFHRDLKPANILVSIADAQATPKIIDFGIARSIDPDLELTQAGASLGTRGYMSPEQAAGNTLDSRTDIYSLGVVLHRLLVGRLPQDSGTEVTTRLSSALAGIADLNEVVRHRSLTRPSQLRRLLSGDLDTIMAKALHRDPGLRYQGSHEFGDDLRRYLAGEPVLARGPGGAYRLRKLIRRHKVATAAAAIAIMALATGFGIAAVGLANERVARRELQAANTGLKQFIDYERDRIRSIKPPRMQSDLRTAVITQVHTVIQARGEDEALTAARVKEIEGLLEHVNFTSVTMEALKQSVFLGAEDGIREGFHQQPEFEATLLHELALSFRDLGLFQMAVAPAKTALETRRRLFGETDEATIDSLQLMGSLSMRTGKYADAISFATAAAKAAEASHGPDHGDTLASRVALGSTVLLLGRYQEAEKIFRSIRAAYTRVGSIREAMSAQTNMATSLLHMGRPEAAEPLLREALDWFKANIGDNEEQTQMTRSSLALVMERTGQIEKGMEFAHKAYLGLRNQLGDEHPKTLTAANIYAGYLLVTGKLAEAARVNREIVRLREKVLGRHHRRTIVSMLNLVRTLCNTHDVVGALAASQRLVDRVQEALPAAHPLIGSALIYRGRALYRNKAYTEAEAVFLRGHEMIAAAYGAKGIHTKDAASCLAELYTTLHQLNPEPEFEQKIAAWTSKADGVQAQLSPPHLASDQSREAGK